MSEIEKMYENAGLHKRSYIAVNFNDKIFTAEKQIELIKWLGRYDYFEVYYRPVQKDWIFGNKTTDSSHYDFTLGLASWVSYLWQDLTEEEKQQVKGILE